MTVIEDYSRYLNQIGRSRLPSPLHSLMPLMKLPGMISLGGGLPNPETFPFAKATITMKDGSTVEISQLQMAEALQYSETAGLQPLVKWILELQSTVHHPPLGIENYSMITGNGSQDLFTRAFDNMLERGDTLLVETPTYAGALAALAPLGCNVVGLETDGEGLIPSALEAKLAELQAKDITPKFLYTVPHGSNPSGASLPLTRKKEIYSIAQKYDLLLLEDDPYYYLQYDERLPSFLSIDTDCRVLRFDSFSKILSSGVRVGFVTGPKPLVEVLNRHIQVTALHPSGISQAFVIQAVLAMGVPGFLKHSDTVSAYYKKRMETFRALAEKYLTGLAEWSPPKAGMFFWLKLRGVDDSFSLIREKALEKKVLLIPGSSFYPNGEKSGHVRASFSSATPEDMEEALKRLAVLLKEHASLGQQDRS